MSTDKDGTQAEVWEKVNGWTPAHPQWMVICKTPHERFPFKVIAKCEDDEPAADAIIADHHKAAQADALEAALEEARTALMAASMSGSTTVGVRMAVDVAYAEVDEALASYASNPAEAEA